MVWFFAVGVCRRALCYEHTRWMMDAWMCGVWAWVAVRFGKSGSLGVWTLLADEPCASHTCAIKNWSKWYVTQAPKLEGAARRGT